uniref:Mitochondrial fission regulator n=1 Tax=Oncorhynchus mykiss TaxID=8022 RepID=A0A8C7RA26_ONCMY
MCGLTITVIPIWQNKPHGSTRCVVRRIGSLVPMKPHLRACFQELLGLPPLRPMDGPMVPTLADIAWIAADEESETYARVRSDSRPRVAAHVSFLVMQWNSSVPYFRRYVKKVETLRKPAVTAMNHTSSLQDELRRLHSLHCHRVWSGICKGIVYIKFNSPVKGALSPAKQMTMLSLASKVCPK